MTDEANSHYYATVMQMIEGHEFLKNHMSKPFNLFHSNFRLQPNQSLVDRPFRIESNNVLSAQRVESDPYGDQSSALLGQKILGTKEESGVHVETTLGRVV